MFSEELSVGVGTLHAIKCGASRVKVSVRLSVKVGFMQLNAEPRELGQTLCMAEWQESHFGDWSFASQGEQLWPSAHVII